MRCPNYNKDYCEAHDYDHVLERRENEAFNESWIEHKNEYAVQEREQERRAFLLDD